MSTPSEIVSMHNTAISSLGKDDVKSVRESLRFTLQMLLQANLEGSQAQNPEQETNPQETTGHVCPSILVPPSISVAKAEDLLSTIIFERLLILLPTETCHEIIGANVLYNLGLLSHMEGVKSKSTNVFNKAMKFYRMSLDIIHTNDENPRFTAILMLALLNNMAQIHLHLDQIDRAAVYMGYLRYALGISVDGTHPARPPLDVYDFDFFLQNVIFFFEGRLKLAAPVA